MTDLSSTSKKAAEASQPEELLTVYENPWFKVIKDGKFHYVAEVSPRNSAAVLPLIGGTHIVLLETFRAAHEGVQMEIPRGYADTREPAALCAQRKLQEDLGYRVGLEKIEYLGKVKPNSSILTTRVNLYLAHISQIEGIRKHFTVSAAKEEGIQGKRLIPVSDLPAWLRSGEIEDAFTLSALAYYIGRGR